MVYNYMEQLVAKALADELAGSPEKYTDVCQCPSCRAFVVAGALNALPPFYVTTLAGKVHGEYQSKDLQNLSDVMVAIGKSIQALQQAKRHG